MSLGKEKGDRTLPFSVIAKPRGAICNLNCVYYDLFKADLFPGSTYCMPDEVLDEFVRQYVQIRGTPVVTFYWQGGEPLLMGLDFFHRVVELQKRYAERGKVIKIAFKHMGLC